MLEDEVLKGTVLLIVQLPQQLQSENALRGFFAQHFKDTQAETFTSVSFNENAGRDSEQQDYAAALAAGEASTLLASAVDIAAVQFASAEAVRHILVNCIVKPLHSGEAGLDFFCGVLNIDGPSVVVEGVVVARTDAPEEEVAKNSPREPMRDPNAPTSAHLSQQEPAESHGGGTTTISQGRLMPIKRGLESTEAAVPKKEKSLVLIFTFFLLYCRQAVNDAANSSRPGHGPIKNFKLNANIVDQILRGDCSPSRIVLIKDQHTTTPRERMPRTCVLVQFEKESIAYAALERFNDTIVELFSPIENPNGRATHQSDHPNMHVEARFRLMADISNRKRPGVASNPDGKHRELAVTLTNNFGYMMIITPENEHARGAAFDRRWTSDTRETRATDLLPQGTPRRGSRDDVSLSSRPIGTDAGAPLQPRERGFERDRKRTNRDDSDESRSRRRRSRSRSWSRGRQRGWAERDTSSGDRRPREREQVREKMKEIPLTSIRVGHPVPAAAVAAGGSANVSTRLVPPPPPVSSDHLGPLPPNWRPIYSEEYRQTYYVYRHPATGVESTTWMRP